ncbi:MAG: DUF4832 domain-containing protein [Eubacterium sp.]|nr:DUF4832 domain-containing protein [Eubacterium sp.]
MTLKGMTVSKCFKKVVAGALALGLTVGLIATPAEAEGVKAHSVRELTEINDINYDESLNETPNPYRGFYKSEVLSYHRGQNNSAADMSEYRNSLVHLRIDISDFTNHDGRDGFKDDIEINSSTTNMLSALDGTLQSLRENNGTAVVRIAYDKDYAGRIKDNPNDSTKMRTVWEPRSINKALQHQQAIGEIFAKYPDVIASVECGVFGPWGEMHSTDFRTEANVKKVVGKWLEVLPDSIPISVRQPEFYSWWSGVPIDEIDSDVTTPEQAAYRVGVYNDGYLGSYDDRGTFRDREREVAWLSNQAKHTLYGGEIVLFEEDVNHPTNVQPTGLYMEQEAFKTHTSYLNVGWNDEIIAKMKKTKFKGNNSLYNNGSLTEFNYVQNHLGYRYVVRNVSLTRETSKYENFALEAGIENVGFANLVKEKKAYLILKSTDGNFEKTYDLGALDPSLGESASNVDPRNWDSTATTSVKVNVDIPDDFAEGKYEVYIKLVTDTSNGVYHSYPIRFSNSSNIYDENLEANYLGSFLIVEGTLEEGSDNSGSGNSGSGNSGNGTKENPPVREINDTNNQNNNNSNNNQNNNNQNSNNSTNNNTNNNTNNSNGSNSNSSTGSTGSGAATNGNDAAAPTYSSEWVGGKWYNEDGSQTYEGTLSWKCNSSGWWVEDTTGWYPASQWQKIDGKWYYFTSDGYMDYGEYRDGCWLGSDGAWVEGYSGGHWCKNSKGWWYEDSSGWYPYSQYLWIDGTEYYFKADGYMK